ncbi:MAG TPA: universal stress protein [Thermoleophilaceae bacterium]|jgi:nucleotide-binding universal stress UspA family protein
MFHRILVGVDDSTASRAALAKAIELVQAGRGRLGLLSSAPPPPPLAGAGPIVLPVSRRELERQLLEWAQRNVEEAARLVPNDVPITKLVTRGAPGAALLREARTGCWDLVVVGQGHRRPRVPLLERVGDRLNRRSPTPVLVVHEEPDSAAMAPRRAGWFARKRRARVAAA